MRVMFLVYINTPAGIALTKETKKMIDAYGGYKVLQERAYNKL